MVYKTKTQKFAILVDEYGRHKPSLDNLVMILEEDYPFLKQANRVITKKRLSAAKKGDYIIFGFSKKYDFRVVSEEQWDEFSVHRRTPVVKLDKDWDEMMDLLDEYVEANYYPEEEKHLCCKSTIYVYDDVDYDNIFVVQQEKKKKPSSKRRGLYINKNDKLEEAQVYHTFVKVGWDVFDIWLNGDGEEYVKIDGNVYWIDRDSNGNGKLSVQ